MNRKVTEETAPAGETIRAAGRRGPFVRGVKDGLPVGLGYLAVSFSLGIAAGNAGLTPWQGFLASLLCNASAGEYALFAQIAAGAALTETALITLVVNARYLLMGCALSQKLRPGTRLIHRLIIGADITDELFGLDIAQPGYLDPWYAYGTMAGSMPFWAVGTALGIAAGDILPALLVNALSVALYGMFLAVIIPPAKKDRAVAACVVVGFAASGLCAIAPGLSRLSSGSRTILLTLIIAGAAALLRPVEEEAEHD